MASKCHSTMIRNKVWGKYLIESKDAIRKRLQRSTDRADAVVMALTYGSHQSIAKKFGFHTLPKVVMKGPKAGRRW